MPLHQRVMAGCDPAASVQPVLRRVPNPPTPYAPELPHKAETPRRTPAWGFYFDKCGASIRPVRPAAGCSISATSRRTRRRISEPARPLCPGGFNRSTQHPFLLIWHVGTVCIWRDMHGHGSRGSRRLSSGSAESAANRWRTRRPGARGTRAVYKILILNGGIASAPRRRASASSVASTG